MCTVDKTIQDGVGERRIADVVMPVVDGQLTGHDAGSVAGTIVEEFEEIVALSWSDGRDGKIVDDQHIDLRDRGESLGEAAIGMAKVELLEEARCPDIPCRQAWCASAQARYVLPLPVVPWIKTL